MSLFVARQTRYGQMRSRRSETSRRVVSAFREGLCRAENKADGCRSAAAVEDDSWMGSRGWKG
jgi:hypothetical protein